MKVIKEKVKKILLDKLGVDESEITMEANFIQDLGADSLDTVELIMEFEKEFDISIPDEEAERMQTVGQVVAYLSGLNISTVNYITRKKEFDSDDEILNQL